MSILGSILRRFLLTGLLPAAMLAAVAPRAIADPIFATPAPSYGVGIEPYSVAVGDLNGDGNPDVVVANAGANTVSVLLGHGDGSFGPKTDFGTGDAPLCVAVGDLNDDSKLDLAVVNSVSHTISVLLGHGDGSYATKVDYGAETGIAFIAIGDVNGDGALDLVSATGTVLLGNGDGTFRDGSGFDRNIGPYSVAIGDLDGDGKPDLATANFHYDAVSVLLGHGDGSFGPATNYPTGNLDGGIATGSAPRSVAMGDLNHDGKSDLVVGDAAWDTVSVLLGHGDGTFGIKADLQVGSFPRMVAIVDVDDDRIPDVVAIGDYSGTVSVLLGRGDGSFQARSDYAIGRGALSMAVGDLNNDGRPDVVTADFSPGSVSVLLNVAPFNARPDCSHAGAAPAIIFAGGHRLVPVDIAGVTDADGDPLTMTVTAVTQDEPVVAPGPKDDDDDDDAASVLAGGASGRGDPGRDKDLNHQCPDAVIDPQHGTVAVRAERSGKGNGRVYTIWFTASDGRGGSCDGSVQVCVPRDHHRLDCIDNGQRFNSLGPCSKGRGGERAAVEAVLTAGVGAGHPGVLQYSLSAPSEVAIAVYDIAGRRVAMLGQGTQNAGVHDVSWDGRGLSRGIYFCRFQTGPVTLAKTTLILK